MNKLLAALVASTFALGSAAALAADPPKDKAAAAPQSVKLEKPAGVTAEAWAKMSDAEKKKAVEDAKAASAKPAGGAATTAAPKVKKGGC